MLLSARVPVPRAILHAHPPRGTVSLPLGSLTCRRRHAFGAGSERWLHSSLLPERCDLSAASSSAAAPGGTSNEPSSSSSSSQKPLDVSDKGVELTAYHYLTFFITLGVGLLFLALLLYSTGDINFQLAVGKVVKRLMKTVALRQVMGILSAMVFVRYGLEPVIKKVRSLTKAQGSWEKSSEYYILRELYKPLEFLFLVAAFTTLAENFLPQLIAIPKSIVQTVVRSTLSLTFVIATCRVVFNIKGRVIRETAWQMELKGDVTRQRRLEAIDKLLSVLTLIVGSVFGLQALGLDVNSVLAIGGVGGLAVGLAGREILENLFTGLIILSSNPFEVGDEVLFRPSSGQVVEGIVLDVGWYRTTIRSFEREHFLIPNSVFSRNVVLNITRKQREWRFYEFFGLRIEDLSKVTAVVSDIRKIVKQDSRIIQKLHRRVFLDKITREEATMYLSFYVEAANRDAFMAVKQDLMLAFMDCVERNGAKLARSRLQLEVLPTLVTPVPPSGGAAAPPGAEGSGAPPLDVPALPAAPAVDVPASVERVMPPGGDGSGSSGGGSGSSGGGSGSSGGSTPPDAPGNAPASNIVPTQGSASGKAGGGVSSSAAAAAAAAAQAAAVAAVSQRLASDPSAMEQLVMAARQLVMADDILQDVQEGGNVLASYDEPAPGAA